MFGHFSSSVTDIGEFCCIFMGDRGRRGGRGTQKVSLSSKLSK